MLNHDLVLFKTATKCYVGPRFIAELKDHIFPKLGIVDSGDIDKIIQGLNYVARKMKDESSKSLNVQLEWEDTTKALSTIYKSPARKTTPKQISTTPVKSTPVPLKPAIKLTSPKPVTVKSVAPQYQEDEEVYDDDYMDEEDA
jgi:hypothetical protein